MVSFTLLKAHAEQNAIAKVHAHNTNVFHSSLQWIQSEFHAHLVTGQLSPEFVGSLLAEFCYLVKCFELLSSMNQLHQISMTPAEFKHLTDFLLFASQIVAAKPPHIL